MKLFEKLFNKKDKKEEIKDKELDMEYENLIYACRKLNLINAEGQMKNDKKHLIEMLEERNILFKKYRLDNVDILFKEIEKYDIKDYSCDELQMLCDIYNELVIAYFKASKINSLWNESYFISMRYSIDLYDARAYARNNLINKLDRYSINKKIYDNLK